MVVMTGTPTFTQPVSFPGRTVGEHEKEVTVATTGGTVETLSENVADDELLTRVVYWVSVGVGEHAIRR